MGSLLFILAQFLVAKAAGIPAIFLRSKEMGLSDVEQNFFHSNYYSKQSIDLLRKAFEKFFGSTNSAIFLRSSAFLFFAALACLVTLLLVYVGASQLFSFIGNGFAIKLQPDEYDRFRNYAGNSFGPLLTEDHFFHTGYLLAITGALFIFAYAILSACSAFICVGLYRFTVWFARGDTLTTSQIFLRLFRLLVVILVADLTFLIVSLGTPIFLGHIVSIEAFQQASVQTFQWTNGPQDMLVYRMGIFRRQVDRPLVQYTFGLGVGPISPSEIIAIQGTPRPIFEKLFSAGYENSSTNEFCAQAGVLDKLECGRRLTDQVFARVFHFPNDLLFGLVREAFDKMGNAVCLETDFVPPEFPPTVRFIFTLYVPFLVNIVLQWVLGALIVPILSVLYLLNRLVVTVCKWQIVRSEYGLSLMTKHGWSFLALPVIVLLAVLEIARKAKCGV